MPSLVQFAGPLNFQSVSSAQISLGNAVGQGHLLIGLVDYVDGSSNVDTPQGVSDGQGLWYTDRQDSQNHTSSSVYSSWNAAAGLHTLSVSIQAAATAGQSNFTLWMLEVAGMSAFPSVDTSTGTWASSTGPVTVTGSPLSNASDFVVVVFNANATETGMVNPTGWQGLGSPLNSYPSGGAAYIVPGSTSALSPSFGTISQATTWTISMVAYKPAATIVTPVPLGGLGDLEMHYR